MSNLMTRRTFFRGMAAGAAICFVPMALGSSELTATPLNYFQGYANYYEFGTSKSDPAKYLGAIKTDGWKIQTYGCSNDGLHTLESLLSDLPEVHRTYRMRCVEAWSMVVPWTGVRLADLIAKLNPDPKAKYIKLTSYHDSDVMPEAGRFGAMKKPYVEGLRLDEAMNDLTLLATGSHGQPLDTPNGSPVRLVVPWKYGFKGIKSIVKIEFTRKAPRTTWMELGPDEYGFYANVNPEVSHPRWSQSSERTLPSSSRWTADRRDTEMFNGYGAEVAHMYEGMNLKKYF